MRCEVLSFQRLAFRIFAETRADPRRGDQTIGPLGRIMVLRRLIRRERHHLVLLGRVADKPGLVKQVAAALDELMRQEITPERLADLAAKDRPERPLESAKLADLTRLYQSYLDYLLTDRLDPAQYLALAAAAASRNARMFRWRGGVGGWLRRVYHPGVPSAGGGWRGGAVRSRSPCSWTHTPRRSGAAIRSRGYTQSLFARTERTVVTLRRLSSKRGGFQARHRRCGCRRPISRLTTCEPALVLATSNASFLHVRLRRRTYRPAALHATPDSLGRVAMDSASVSELPDRRAEVTAAIEEIQRLTREAGMRYREIAIIVRDLGPYHDLIDSLMAPPASLASSISGSRRRIIPSSSCCAGLLAVACDDCRFESLRGLLKTGLLPLEQDEADLLENYLLATGVQGWEAWQKEWRYKRAFHVGREGMSSFQKDRLGVVNRVRESLAGVLGPWMAAVQAGKQGGLQWATALYECLAGLKTDQKIEAWADAAQDDGRTDEADACTVRSGAISSISSTSLSPPWEMTS